MSTEHLTFLRFFYDEIPFYSDYSSGLLLQSILTTFPLTFISTRANRIVHILAISDNDGITKGQLFRLLGIKLSKCAPPQDQRLAILNGAWKTINTLTHASEFIHCVEPWAEYTSQHFGVTIYSSTFFCSNLFIVIIVIRCRRSMRRINCSAK